MELPWVKLLMTRCPDSRCVKWTPHDQPTLDSEVRTARATFDCELQIGPLQVVDLTVPSVILNSRAAFFICKASHCEQHTSRFSRETVLASVAAL
jgi:hypothetical protein